MAVKPASQDGGCLFAHTSPVHLIVAYIRQPAVGFLVERTARNLPESRLLRRNSSGRASDVPYTPISTRKGNRGHNFQHLEGFDAESFGNPPIVTAAVCLYPQRILLYPRHAILNSAARTLTWRFR